MCHSIYLTLICPIIYLADYLTLTHQNKMTYAAFGTLINLIS